MSKLAFGTTLAWNSQTVAKLIQIGAPDLSRDAIDVTTHQSADQIKEYLPGLIEAGEVPMSGNFDYTDTAGQHAMLTDFYAGTVRTGLITFPAATGATWTLTGFISKIKIADAPLNGAIPFTATIKLTAKPTFAVATSAGLTTPFFTISESAVITPAAAGGVYTYVASVLTGVTSVVVTPTAAAGVITVNGSTVATGVPSSAITLGAAGTVTTITIVVTETNKAPKTYTIYLSRAAS